MISGQRAFLDGTIVISGAPLARVVDEGGGDIVLGAVSEAVRANALVLNDPVQFDTPQCLVRLGAFLVGNPSAGAGETVRGAVYTADGSLVAVGEEVVIDQDQPPTLVSLLFPDFEGVLMPPGEYRYGLFGGAIDKAARYYLASDSGRTTYSGVPYLDGAPDTLGAGAHADAAAIFFIETIAAVTIPDTVTDDYLATLPFDLTQRVFLSSGPVSNTRQSAAAGWYGTKFDPTAGANAIVRSDGPLAGLVGERVLVTRHGPIADRIVAVYVHDERTFPDEIADEDIILTARAFLAIGDQALDSIDVTVEVLA